MTGFFVVFLFFPPTILKTVYHKLESLCDHLMSDCIFSEISVYLQRRKSGEGLGKNSKLPKSAQPVRVWKRMRQEREKNVKKETANEACFNKKIDGDEEKMLCASMISVHGQTRGVPIEVGYMGMLGGKLSSEDGVREMMAKVWPTRGCR